MDDDRSRSPLEAARPAPVVLDYHRPTKPVRMGRLTGKQLGSVAIVIGGVTFLGPANWMQPLGAGVVFLGLGCWVWSRRPGMSWLLRAQVVCAALMVALGMFLVWFGMNGAQPPGRRYWLVENQTYGQRRSRISQPAWISVVGLAWMVVVVIAHGTRVLAARRARRNNHRPPSQQE